MKFLTLILFTLLTSFTLLAQENTELTRKQSKMLDEAVKFGNKSNPKQAIGILRQIYKENPDNIDVNYNMGLSYVNLSGNPDSALYFFDRVVKLDNSGIWTEDDVELHLAICRAYQLKYDFENALKELALIREKEKSDYAEDRIKREFNICQNAITLMANPVRLEVENLGPKVNSVHNDYRPVLSNSETELYFTSRRRRDERRSAFDDGQFEESIFCMSVDGKGGWTSPRRVSGLFDARGRNQESATCIANNDKEMYIFRAGKIYVSTRDTISAPWQEPEELPEPINGYGDIKYAFVTADGEQMFFSSNCGGGFGGYDIYRSRRLPNGDWGVPLNLGAGINTEYDEDAPVMHPTKNILYFSSQGHNSMGGYDIFYAPQNEDGTFDAVVNIGYPINTPDDDIYFIPSSEKDVAYYASIQWNKESKEHSAMGYDLYKVIYDEPEVNKMAVYKGIVMADDLKDIKISALMDDKQVGLYRPNVNGQYVIILETDRDYSIKVSDGDSVTTFVANADLKESYYHSGGRTIQLSPVDLRTKVLVPEKAVAQEVVSERPVTETASAQSFGSSKEDDSNVASSAPVNASGNKTAEGSRISVSEDEQGYTIQILSLREPLEESRLIGVESCNLIEHKYVDGWYVYSYKVYGAYNDAKDALDNIVKSTPYQDAFIRKLSRYKKFVSPKNN